MFQSVIETQGMRSGRFGTGAVISFAVHTGLLLGVLWLTAAPPTSQDPEVFMGPLVRPLPPKGVATPLPKTQARTAAPRPRQTPNKAPKHAPPTPPEPVAPEPPSASSAASTASSGEGPEGHPEGADVGGIAGVPFVPGSLVGPPTGEDVLRFGAGMTPPRLVSGPALEYTREALEARVEGTLVVKCVITRAGETEDCRVLKGLPHLSESVRSALDARRYTPVTFQGRPVSVDYVFNVKLQLPQ